MSCPASESISATGACSGNAVHTRRKKSSVISSRLSLFLRRRFPDLSLSFKEHDLKPGTTKKKRKQSLLSALFSDTGEVRRLVDDTTTRSCSRPRATTPSNRKRCRRKSAPRHEVRATARGDTQHARYGSRPPLTLTRRQEERPSPIRPVRRRAPPLSLSSFDPPSLPYFPNFPSLPPKEEEKIGKREEEARNGNGTQKET